jgi:hypothetical protein
MLIGQNRAGKTSLKKSLLGMPFDPEEQSTVGIEVDPSSFGVDVDQVKNWQRTDGNLGVSQFAQEIASMVAKELDKEKAKKDLEAQDVSQVGDRNWMHCPEHRVRLLSCISFILNLLTKGMGQWLFYIFVIVHDCVPYRVQIM